MFKDGKDGKDGKGDYDGIPYVSLSSPQLSTPERMSERKIPGETRSLTSKDPSLDPIKVKETRRVSHRSDHGRSDSPPIISKGRDETHIREVSIYNEESIRRLSYPGEAIFPDNFAKDAEPKLTHTILKDVLTGAIGKIKKSDMWRRLVACKDHRYIYYSKDLYSYSQLQPTDIICFMEKAITKEFGIMFLSYVVVRDRPIQDSTTEDGKGEKETEKGKIEKKYLFWIIHFLDSKFQTLTDTQRSNLEVHKNNYLDGLFERYKCFDYDSHISTIWKSYGLEDEELFDFRDGPAIISNFMYSDSDSVATDDTPRTSSSDSSPRVFISPRSDNRSPRSESPRAESPRVIFLGKKKKSKKSQFGYLSLSPRNGATTTIVPKSDPRMPDPRMHKTDETIGTISLNLPPEIIDALHTGSLSVSITFEPKHTEVDVSHISREISKELPRERRSRSYSTGCLREDNGVSADEKRKAWITNSNKQRQRDSIRDSHR